MQKNTLELGKVWTFLAILFLAKVPKLDLDVTRESGEKSSESMQQKHQT